MNRRAFFKFRHSSLIVIEDLIVIMLHCENNYFNILHISKLNLKVIKLRLYRARTRTRPTRTRTRTRLFTSSAIYIEREHERGKPLTAFDVDRLFLVVGVYERHRQNQTPKRLQLCIDTHWIINHIIVSPTFYPIPFQIFSF